MARSAFRVRVLAVLEVLAVFAMTHVAFRVLVKFTAVGRWEQAQGLNFSPGAVMIIATVTMLVIHWQRANAWGLTARPVRDSANLGVLMFVVMAIAGAIVMACGVALRPVELTGWSAVIVSAVGLGCVALVLWTVQRWPGMLRRVPVAVSVVVVALVLMAPIAMTLDRGTAVGPIALAVAWRVIGAGIGEEVFFRGYVQSRLNEAFGRPWRVLGVRFGMGLVIASLLFGLIHALNPVDYFAGSFTFAWWHGLTTALGPYGWLREKTGSVAAGAIAHALVDVAAMALLAQGL